MGKYAGAGIVMLILSGILSFTVHAADVPSGVALSSTEASITVQWDRESDADSYNIYWGTSESSLNQSATVQHPTTEYTISNLEAGTEYFIAVTSVENGAESNRSAVESITTESDEEPPATPTGFDITSLSGISETSVRFKWDESSEADLENYLIYYGTLSGEYSDEVTADADSTAKTVTGLSRATRYFFTIAALDASGNESEKADELIVDTLPDSLAPNPPEAISGALAGAGELKVTIDSGNEQMVDFAGNIVYYGTESGVYDYQRDIGDAGEVTFQTLPEDQATWFFTASAYDESGNESSETDEISVEIEDVQLFLDDTGDFDGGCFIRAAGGDAAPYPAAAAAAGLGGVMLGFGWMLRKRRLPGLFLLALVLLVGFAAPSRAESWERPGLHTTGLTVGYYVPQDSQYDHFYGDDSFPVSLFFDRLLGKWVSMEIKAGYWKDSGNLLTVSGNQTGIGSEIEVVPASLSLKVNFPVADYISGYFGLGPDYWYVSEDPSGSAQKTGVSEWVGGYHGKIGVMFYNTDERYEGTGALLETGYSVIDRFGDNQTDIGGWITEFGIFYQF